MSLQLSDVTERVRTGSSEVVPPNSFVIVTTYQSNSSGGEVGRIITPPGVRYSDIRSAIRSDNNYKGFATLVKFT